MTYRDTFEKCPRCAVELTDARSARGCRQCGGLWVDEQVLTEMVHDMLPPRPFGRLVLAILDRTDHPIGCPSCGVKMEAVTIHEVVLDRCPKQHGIWFDARELEHALRRVALRPDEAPLAELVHTSPPLPARPVRAAVRRIVFRIEPVDADAYEVTITDPSVIKIGRLQTAQLRVVDPDVSRIHAVIEVTGDAVQVIDLGSASGTLVNGAAVNRARLSPGDALVVGATAIRVLEIAL